MKLKPGELFMFQNPINGLNEYYVLLEQVESDYWKFFIYRNDKFDIRICNQLVFLKVDENLEGCLQRIWPSQLTLDDCLK